jgi:hypothetical protein|tara:strand:+ start:1116 stop:1304 length:189 start_codon:yes stop_codon:yes gene_type:complete
MNIKSVKKVEYKISEGASKDYTMLKVTLQDDSLVFVPQSSKNTDYQAILTWVAEGNTIAEAD